MPTQLTFTPSTLTALSRTPVSVEQLDSDMDILANSEVDAGWSPIRCTLDVVVEEGFECMEVVSTTATQHFGPYFNQIELEQGATYDYSLTFKADAGHEMFFYADFYADDGQNESGVYFLYDFFNATGEWETRTGSYTAPTVVQFPFVNAYWGFWWDTPSSIGSTFHIKEGHLKKRSVPLTLTPVP